MSTLCPPAIALSGDPPAVAAIAEALHEDGIDRATEGCAAEQVRIERSEAGFVLTIADIDGRLATRVVRDLATAVALVESFGRSSERVAPPAVVAAATSDREDPLAATAREDKHPRLHYALAVGEETSITPDRSLWFGLRGAACVYAGKNRIGGALRLAYDAGLTGDVGHEALRTGVDLLVTLAHPTTRGRWTLVPGVGVGVGWLRVRGHYPDGDDDAISVDAGGVRAEVRLDAMVPLSPTVDLRLGASATLAPIAHTRPFMADGGTAPGEPRGFGRLEIGLELR